MLVKSDPFKPMNPTSHQPGRTGDPKFKGTRLTDDGLSVYELKVLGIEEALLKAQEFHLEQRGASA